jgi:hypothetical protein
MKRTCSLVAAAVASLALSAAAAGVGQDKIPYLSKQGPTESKSTTLTGCVARGSTTGSHTLTNITRDADDAAKDAFQGVAVVLSGADVDFGKHVGHKVSVTGSYAGHPRAIGTASADVKEGEMKTTGILSVTSLTMLADSCSIAASLRP